MKLLGFVNLFLPSWWRKSYLGKGLSPVGLGLALVGGALAVTTGTLLMEKFMEDKRRETYGEENLDKGT